MQRWIEALIAAAFVVAQFGIFIRWIYRRIRDDQIQRVFIREIALNHLPHIYVVLNQIAIHMKLKVSDPPPIRWLEINGKSK